MLDAARSATEYGVESSGTWFYALQQQAIASGVWKKAGVAYRRSVAPLGRPQVPALLGLEWGSGVLLVGRDLEAAP